MMVEISISLCANRSFLRKSVLRTLEKVLFQNDKQLFLLASIVSQRYMIMMELVLDYI